jgi:L-asparaginase
VPRVQLLATGGTVASRHTDAGRSAATPAADLLASAWPPPDVDGTVSDLSAVGSFALSIVLATQLDG